MSNRLTTVIDETLTYFVGRLGEEFPDKDLQECQKGAMIELAANAGCDVIMSEQDIAIDGVTVDRLVGGRMRAMLRGFLDRYQRIVSAYLSRNN